MTDAQPPPRPRTANSSSSSRSWIPAIPAPLQRLFDSVPLVTYPPNELPYRSPGPSSLPTLHVFISEEDAAKSSPSFNPSCLKWQTFLRIAGVRVRLVPSTNHASPTGALPFLLPPATSTSSSSSSADSPASRPIPSSKLPAYAAQHGTTQRPEPPAAAGLKLSAYESLLDTRIRGAWLYALYLSPPNTEVLRRLYIRPCSRSGVVQGTILFQLRRAAASEITKADGKVDAERIYAAAAGAFEALETLLGRGGGGGDAEEGSGADGGESGGSAWFFGAREPGLFDAAVFSYTYLLLHARWPWVDDSLHKMLVKQPRLVAHARKMLDKYWGDQESEWTRIYHDSNDQK